MLKILTISNLSVVNKLQVEFQKGLNILSGETGSGKSIIIEAVGLLLGEKGSADMIRTGEQRAFVEGIFSIEGNSPLLKLLATSGILVEDEEMVIKREIQSTGRNRIFINSQAANVALLRELQPHLLDIHGQGDQQSLLEAHNHMKLLDAFAGADELREDVSEKYEDLKRLHKAHEEAVRSESDRLQRLDILGYQLAELDRAEIRPGEDESLEAERRILANAEEIAAVCADGYRLLYEDDRSMLSVLAGLHRRLEDILIHDNSFSACCENITNIKYAVEEVAFFLRDYADQIEISPERLRFVEERLDELDRIKRKYAGTLNQILEKQAAIKLQYEDLLYSKARRNELEQSISDALTSYLKAAEKLSELRRKGAKALEASAAKEMAAVALSAARFSVQLRSERNKATAGREGEVSLEMIGREGLENVEFYFTANPGEAPGPLGSVASGGELSRLMLVLKTVTAPTRFPRTLIFDEIDAGIGGSVAEAVGQRLKRLALSNQVLCVTHQAQIARYADAHFLVTKTIKDDRTIAGVAELTDEGRVDELARMIGGVSVTSVARRHARELLDSVRAANGGQGKTKSR